MSPAEIEIERQQVVGQIYSVNKELIPEGAARWAEWALEDKLNYEGFNPALYRQNNRRGEDAVSSSPFNSEGKYPGYPYDKNYLNHDLHMLASTGRKDNYDPRMNPEYRLGELGIPGLTDGKNVALFIQRALLLLTRFQPNGGARHHDGADQTKHQHHQQRFADAIVTFLLSHATSSA